MGTPNGTGPFSRSPIQHGGQQVTDPRTERVHAAVSKERRQQLARICEAWKLTESSVIDRLIRLAFRRIGKRARQPRGDAA